MELRESGGEGGIRTLGTGVSPYNGLAITRFHMPGVRNQQLTFGKLHCKLGEMALFGSICATIVQPEKLTGALPIRRGQFHEASLSTGLCRVKAVYPCASLTASSLGYCSWLALKLSRFFRLMFGGDS